MDLNVLTNQLPHRKMSLLVLVPCHVTQQDTARKKLPSLSKRTCLDGEVLEDTLSQESYELLESGSSLYRRRRTGVVDDVTRGIYKTKCPVSAVSEPFLNQDAWEKDNNGDDFYSPDDLFGRHGTRSASNTLTRRRVRPYSPDVQSSDTFHEGDLASIRAALLRHVSSHHQNRNAPVLPGIAIYGKVSRDGLLTWDSEGGGSCLLAPHQGSLALAPPSCSILLRSVMVPFRFDSSPLWFSSRHRFSICPVPDKGDNPPHVTQFLIWKGIKSNAPGSKKRGVLPPPLKTDNLVPTKVEIVPPTPTTPSSKKAPFFRQTSVDTATPPASDKHSSDDDSKADSGKPRGR
ncbi:unnamed protein product [Cyprideis torosa]|uniref:Uncharacterized protein n=1 Tax=Cyprideis torosa TaxID=163714 RepID=A0A7R8WEI0_9CRUS|nr:unnamed protein product [Cyprideis torosa]CAG0895697.1 unnamed protein product [Cyprideis torosa]